MLVPSLFASSGDDARLERVLDVIYKNLGGAFILIYTEIFT